MFIEICTLDLVWAVGVIENIRSLSLYSSVYYTSWREVYMAML